MKKPLLVLSFMTIFYGCDAPVSNSAITDSLNVNSEKDKDNLPKSWTYNQKQNAMTSETDFFAQLDSDSTLNFDFPYNGGSSAYLMIRKREGETDLMLGVSKGQFNSNAVDGETIRIKFDSNKPKRYECSQSSDGGTDLLFIHPANKLVSQIKKAKKIIIEAEFYNNGVKHIPFNVDGLKWSH